MILGHVTLPHSVDISHRFGRYINVAIMMFVSIFTVMIVWYITQPFIVGVVNACQNFATNYGINSTLIGYVYPILRTLANYWGPAITIFLLIIWALMSTEVSETRGEYNPRGRF
jgi:phosphotransferase system  glucose/maltose/N-acetylglucosamine-specific IIC component